MRSRHRWELIRRWEPAMVRLAHGRPARGDEESGHQAGRPWANGRPARGDEESGHQAAIAKGPGRSSIPNERPIVGCERAAADARVNIVPKYQTCHPFHLFHGTRAPLPPLGSSDTEVHMRLAPASLAAALLVALVAPAHSSTWTPQTSPTTDALNGVAWSDSSTWVAVGDFGTIIRSTDAGISWGPVTSPVGDQLHGVALRGNLGLAVGVGGRILRSTDAGASWTVVARPTTKILFAASIADSFAVITGEEGRIFYSLD